MVTSPEKASPKFATNQSNDPWPHRVLRAANKMRQEGWTYRQSCEAISASSSSSCCCCSLLASLLQSGILYKMYKTIKHPHTVSGRQTFQDYLCHQVTRLLATGPGTGVFLLFEVQKCNWNQRGLVEFHDIFSFFTARLGLKSEMPGNSIWKHTLSLANVSQYNPMIALYLRHRTIGRQCTEYTVIYSLPLL